MSDVHGAYDERLHQLNLTTLEERRIRGDAIEMFKYMHGLWNIERDSLFTLRDSNRPATRQQQTYMPLEIPRAKLNLRNNFFSLRGARLWNSLPSNVRESGTVNTFKNNYDKYVKH